MSDPATPSTFRSGMGEVVEDAPPTGSLSEGASRVPPAWLGPFAAKRGGDFYDFRRALFEWAVRAGRVVHEPSTVHGVLVKAASPNAIQHAMEHLGFSVVVREGASVMMVHDEGVIWIRTPRERARRKKPPPRSVAAEIVTVSAELADRMAHALRGCLDPHPPQKRWLHVIVERPTEGGPELVVKRLSEVEEPLVRRNYSAKALEGYDHVLEDLCGSDPCGQLALLEGPPGAGKTYMVRALVSHAQRAHFALIPSSLVQRLGDPHFLPALLDAPRRITQMGGELEIGVEDELDDDPDSALEWPLVLVLEDAESALLPRDQGGALDAVSAVLNLSDGLMGAALNVRLLVTTNASEVKLDEAVKRRGRLCRHIHIGELDVEQAQEVLGSLGGGEMPKLRTLAELYHAARVKAESQAP